MERAWTTLTKPKSIARVVRDINRKQYHQAHVTPFGSGPVANAFGPSGDTPVANNILNGTIPPNLQSPPLLPETRRILESNATAYPSVQDGTGTITNEEFIAAYSVSKESTSSSPSGRHIGHYKAATKDPTLAQLHSRMMSFPFVHG